MSQKELSVNSLPVQLSLVFTDPAAKEQRGTFIFWQLLGTKLIQLSITAKKKKPLTFRYSHKEGYWFITGFIRMQLIRSWSVSKDNKRPNWTIRIFLRLKLCFYIFKMAVVRRWSDVDNIKFFIFLSKFLSMFYFLFSSSDFWEYPSEVHLVGLHNAMGQKHQTRTSHTVAIYCCLLYRASNGNTSRKRHYSTNSRM